MIPENLHNTCWITIENQSNKSILVRKYKKIDFFSEQRVFHPEETGIMTEGMNWDKKFVVKIFFISGKNLKTKYIKKLTVNKIYKITIFTDRFSCKTIKEENIDKQLCSYQRMEEIWENSNYYDTLRISKNATQREIRIAYLKLAREYHPDHNSNPNARLMFERIVEAYNTLSDEEIRKKYDIQLRTDSGILSKSYWRQLFCVWNRHKAFQVGISTLLTITGSVLLLTSLIALPSGIGLPAGMVTGAVGGGLFASGIGGLSVALSRSAALEDNRLYKRWLKFSFWYGIAGAALGAFSAGIGSAVGTAVGGVAGIMALATIKGAASGICFSSAHGIASDKWLKMIKKLRIDTIAMDLLIGSVTGAALGIIFEGALMTSKIANAVASQAKMSSKTFLKKSPEQQGENILEPKQKNRALLYLEYESKHHYDDEQKKKIIQTEENQKLVIENNVFLSNDEINEEKEDFCLEFNSIVNYEFSDDSDDENSDECKENIKDFNDISEIEEYLKCEDSSVESINEAIELYEMVVHQPTVQIITFHNLSSIYKVRIFIEYTITENDDVKFYKESSNSGESFKIPILAKFIQIYFEYSPFGIKWKPICNSNDVPIVFNFEKPVSRRFFLNSHSGVMQICQIRDEFEQTIESHII